MKLQFVPGTAKYSGEDNVLICVSATAKHSFENLLSVYWLSSINAEAIKAPAEASRGVLGIAGSSKSQ